MFLKNFKMVNFKKVTVVLTAASFMLSVFTLSGWAAPSQTPLPSQPAKIASPSDYIIPFNIGRITDALNTGNGKVIVNIQDLHAHEETQRNINGILTMLDAKYGINKVYVEGAVGQVSTGWLANIEDESFREAAIAALMKEGKLSGAEYYSIKSSKINILHGIENRKLYIENFARLDEIYKKRDEIQNLIPEIKIFLNNISEQYYSKENTAFLKVVDRYKTGEIGADKYFKYLLEKAGVSGVNFANYASIVNFAKMIKLQSSFSNKKLNSQLSELIGALKSEMPYVEYKKIAELFDKKDEEGNLYLALANVYDKSGFGGRYKELEKFFEMIRLNQSINPVDLVTEERQLSKEVMYRFAKTNTEIEILFLNDMFSTFENYLNNKVSAKEYDFFEKSLPKFKMLWERYADIDGLPELEKYYDLFDKFYKVNIERNRYFLEQITGLLPEQTKEKIRLIKNSEQKSASKLLENAKNIDVVITGGFHTHDLAKLMGDNGYSYIVITPNVTQDTSLSERNYDANILRQAEVLQNTFKDMLESGMLNFAENNPIPYIASYITSFEILRTAENEGKLNNFPSIFSQMAAENAQELKDKFKIEDLSVGVPIKDGDKYQVTFTYKDAQGNTQEVKQDIAQNTERLNYDTKRQDEINRLLFAIPAILVGMLQFAVGTGALFTLGAPIAAGISLSVGVCFLTASLFNLAGYSQINIVRNSLTDFENYVTADTAKPFETQETNIAQIASMRLPNGMTQDEFIRYFENRLRGSEDVNIKLAPEITIRSIFDASAPADIAGKKLLSLIATVSESDPNVIYVNPIALFFLDKRSGELAEDLIANHEQRHTAIGGAKGEIRTVIEDTYNLKFVRKVLSALKRSRTEKTAKAKLRNLKYKIANFEYRLETIEKHGIQRNYYDSIKDFYVDAKDFLKLLNDYPYLAVDEFGKVELILDGIASFISRSRSLIGYVDTEEVGDLNKLESSLLKQLDSMYPGIAEKALPRADVNKTISYNSQKIEEIIKKFEQYGVKVDMESDKYTNSARISFDEFLKSVSGKSIGTDLNVGTVEFEAADKSISEKNIEAFNNAFVKALTNEKNLDIEIRSFVDSTVKGDAVLQFLAGGKAILRINPIVGNKDRFEKKMALILDIFERARKDFIRKDTIPAEIQNMIDAKTAFDVSDAGRRRIAAAKEVLKNKIFSPKSIFVKYDASYGRSTYTTHSELTDEEAEEIEQMVVSSKERGNDPDQKLLSRQLDEKRYFFKNIFWGQMSSIYTRDKVAEEYYNNIYDGVKARETLFLYEVVNRLKNDRKIIREAFGRKTDVRVSAESVIFKYMTEKEKKIVSAKAVKEALFEEVTFLIGSSLLTKDSTRDGAIEFLNKKFFRFFGMNPERAERIVDSKIGRTILIAAVAPFAELSELMGIFDASEAADEAEKQKGLKDEGARDRRRFANELLTNFLDGHKGYRAGYESDPMIGINEKQKKYWTGAKKIIKASASAYNVVLKLTRVRAIARLAAKIANVISHSAVNLSQPDTALTQDRAEATIEKIIEKFQQYGVTVIPETTEYTNSAKIYFNEFFNNIRFMRSQENIDRFLKAFVEVLRTEKKLDVDIRSVFDFTADTVKGDAILEFSARGIILHINPVVQNKAFYEEKMALVLDIFERALKNTYFDSLPDEVIEKNEESGIKEAEAESPIRDVETAKKFLENEISSPKSIFEKYNPDGSNIELTDAEADEIEQIVVIAKENVRADRTPTTIFLTLQRRGFIVKGAFSGQWTSQKTKNEFAAKYFNNIYYGIKAREILLKYESVLNSEDVVSAGAMAALSDSLARYVALLKAALRNFIIGKSTVDIKAPELKGKSATIVTAEYTPDIMSRARTLAAQGIDVNIIMPYDIELPEEIGAATQYMSYVYSDERSSAAVWQYCEKDSSFGKNINIYMYDQTDMPAGRRAEAGIDPNIVYAQKTLEWLKEQSLKRGEYNFGIIDIHPNTGINYELAQNMFPDSVIVHSVSKTSSSMETLESSKPGYMPYYEGQEESLIITAGEQLRNRNKNSYMKTSPIFSTTIDISKMPLTDFNSDAELSELKSYGFDTMVIKLDETNTVSDIETLRNVLTRAHKKNIKVVIEYAFADYAAFESWTASLGSQLASFRASTNIVQGAKEFVDGIRLDLSQMSDADAKKASEKFLAVRRIISAESADAVFGVKSSYYDEALYQAAKIRPVRTISHENKDALNMAGNAWVEFSVGKESYDQQSLDYDITSQDIEKVVTAKTTDIVGIDYDIIKALKKSEDIPFSALNMLRNVFLQRVAAFRNTPEGTFNSARALAVRQNVFVSRSDEAVLYRSLAELRAGKNVSAAADAIASILTGSALMADLALQLKNANEENAALIIKNIEGYVQGALENTEITNYEKQSGKKINYVIKTNKDMLGQMLVEAKLALSARGIDAAMKINKASEDVPYGIELNPRSDEESLRILRNENNEQLEKVIDLLNSLDAVPATEAFAIIQEAINILNSLVESEALSENAKPIALSELLALLALKADFMPGNIVDTTSEGMRNIAANTRAVLAAA